MRYKYIIPILSAAVALLIPTSFVLRAESPTYIEFYYGEHKFVYIDEYIEPTNHIVAEEIFERKINAPLNEKLDFVASKLRGGADYKTALLTSFPLLSRTVDEIVQFVSRDPVDSQIKFEPSRRPMFTITREKEGIKVNTDRLYMDIWFALMSSEYKVNVPVQKIAASVTSSDNIALTNRRAIFSTDFSSSTSERKHNISLALSKISGTVLAQGETLSFNEKVGRRTAKNGFMEAKIIMGGKYVPGVGGGVCQASTTLYNAALLSDLSVIAVSRHSLQSSYVSPSFDAMVNSGSSDLKIRNDGDSPVFIRAYCDDNRAYVEIYGSKLPYTIKRKSEVTFTGSTPDYDEVTDVNYEHFEKGTESGARKTISYSHPEVHSNGYLMYYDAYGKLIESKHIRSDVYAAVKGVIAVAP